MPFSAVFIFNGKLNDLLPKFRKEKPVIYSFNGKPSVKDCVEALGVPHPEVGRILVNSAPVNFEYLLKPGDQVEVFPVKFGEHFSEGYTLQPQLPQQKKFVLDVHLGKLAKALRMLGFDVLYENNYSDKVIARLAFSENRIVLTRDVNLLKIKSITWGYWLRSQHLEAQLREVIMHFNLQQNFAPFTRCLECNGLILPVAKEKVKSELPPNTCKFFYEFYQCANCRKVYWKGSHYERMEAFIQGLQGE